MTDLTPEQIKYVTDMDARIRRIETRLCRLMLALDVDPNRSPDEQEGAMRPKNATPPLDYAPEPRDRWSQVREKLLSKFANNEELPR